MTSASNPPAVLDTDRIDATAERIATDWAYHGHSVLTAMIAELYTDLAKDLAKPFENFIPKK